MLRQYKQKKKKKLDHSFRRKVPHGCRFYDLESEFEKQRQWPRRGEQSQSHLLMMFNSDVQVEVS